MLFDCPLFVLGPWPSRIWVAARQVLDLLSRVLLDWYTVIYYLL